MKISLSSIDRIVFLLFVILYFSFAIPFMSHLFEILRWIGVCGLFIWSLLATAITENKINIKTRLYLLLFFPFIISIFVLDYALVYGTILFISLVILIISLDLFFGRKKLYIDESLTIFEVVLFVILIYQFALFLKSPTFTTRFFGTFDNPNHLAPFTIFGFLLSLKNLYIKKNIFTNIFVLVISLVLSLATGSRIAIIMLMFLILFVTFIFNNKNRFRKIFIIGVIGILMITILYRLEIPSVHRLFSFDGSGNTGFSRGSVWYNAFKLYYHKPIFGWGYGSVRYHIYVNNPTNFNGFGMHNSYLMILVENGIIGSIFYFILFIKIITIIIKIYLLTNYNKQIITMKFVSIGILLMLLYGVSESFILAVGNPSSALLFWYPVILIINNYKKID